MSTPVISALGNDVAVALGGTGSFVPENRVSNRQILDRVRVARPDGRLLEPEWIERHVGIVERRLDFDFDTQRKRSRAEGGLYDGDLALRAARGRSKTPTPVRPTSTCSCTSPPLPTRSRVRTTCDT
jgi:hypothetical protein